MLLYRVLVQGHHTAIQKCGLKILKLILLIYRLPTYLSTYLPIYLSTCLPVYLRIYTSILQKHPARVNLKPPYPKLS